MARPPALPKLFGSLRKSISKFLDKNRFLAIAEGGAERKRERSRPA